MDKCGICDKPVVQLFETGKDGVYACFKCQPLVPEVTIDDSGTEPPDPSEAHGSNDEESNDKMFYCGICHKSFQKTMQLQNHLRNHRAERRFVCTYCNKAFSQSNNLRAHLRIHTNERPFKCSECGKAFTQVTNLNNHVRLHTGERPFVCPEPGCNKAYAQVTNLNQHRKRHLNGRPVESTYDCTVCGEQFQQRNHMYTHRREAHPSQSDGPCAARPALRCGRCPARLPSERLLRLHVLHHETSDAADDNSDNSDARPRRVAQAARLSDTSEYRCPARLPSERLLRLHVLHHETSDAADDNSDNSDARPRRVAQAARLSDTKSESESEAEKEMPCVFSTCSAVVRSAREHTEHLLRAHQLRVLAAPAATPPPRRGRPPKILKDPLDPKENTEYHDIKIMRSAAPTYLPKLKVQSLFQ